MTPAYRADIDGLRAVAVLSILFYHVGIDAFGGGYVGVDIFFVISGFLITTIIARELREQTFTIGRFYERRVRRILPALTVVLVVTLLAGYALLPPGQLEELARSALATSVFSSNIFFFAGSGYFDGPSEAKPLLHTWSLAVEEQYYILFPLILMFIHRRFAGRFVLPVAVIAGLSFIACVLVTPVDATASFFLIPFRAWELLIGSLLALGCVPALASAMSRNLVATAGLAAVLTSVFAYTSSTEFPGIAAALPTLGTAAVIHAGSEGRHWFSRALGWRPLVFVGLISYSLYLWHWPLVVYAKLMLINEFNDAERTAVVLASFILATLSWRFVEAPFRDRARFASRQKLFVGAGTVTAAVMGVALIVVVQGGMPARDLPSGMQEIVAADPGWAHWKACEELGEVRNDDPELCSIGDEGEPTFMLWGDSHALAMASAVHLKALEYGKSGLIAVRTGCAPLLGIDRQGRTSCRVFNTAVAERLVSEQGIDTVIVAARWTLSANGDRYRNEPGSSVTLEDASGEAGSNARLFELGLTRTLDRLAEQGKTTVLVGQVPEVGIDVPSSNYTARLTGRDVTEMIAPTVEEFRERTATVTAVLDRVSEGRGLSRIEPSSILCGNDRCQIVIDGTPLYRDDNHLSLRGNVLVAPLLDETFSAGPGR